MLHHIVSALGQVPSFYTATLAPQAADALAAEHAERGRTPVVIFDEAHLLDNAQMEAVRMLTNHNMDSGAPFAALLIGQPTLRQRLRLGVLAALDQRISVRYALAGMSATETADYITHHLKIAGRADTLFSADAITLIHNASRGYPRAINNLAVNALTAAFAPRQRHRRRESRPHRNLRDRRRLTRPASPRRAPRHQDDQGPVRNQRAGPSHTQIPGNTDDGIICKISDGQHPGAGSYKSESRP